MGVQTDFLDTGPAKLKLGKALAGTVASTGTALTGTGTTFLTSLTVGQMVYEPVKRGYSFIASITTDTAAVLTVAFNSNLPGGTTLYAMTDMGDTKGGIDLEWTTSTYKKSTDRLGVVGEIINDRQAKLIIPLSDWKPAAFQNALADILAVVTQTTKTLVRFSKSVGLDLTTLGVPAAIVPIFNGVDSSDPNRISIFHNLCPSAETLQLKFDAAQQRPITVTYYAWALADGEIGYIGDNSIRP